LTSLILSYILLLPTLAYSALTSTLTKEVRNGKQHVQNH
jgi:hypothetical protein